MCCRDGDVSAYVMSYVCLGGGYMSEVYMLKSERTPPCGTPVELTLDKCSVSKCCVCFSFFYVVSDEYSDGVGYASVCELVN